MNIINKKITEIKPYENNPRYNENAVQYVANSIKEFGFKVPLVIDKDNVIVCGHTRYSASKLLGLKELPCVVADDLTEEQIKAFRIADNKVSEFSEWDMDLLAVEVGELKDMDFSMDAFGFEDFEFPEEMNGEPKEYDEESDVIEEAPKVPFSKSQDIWLLGKHRVMCGSSTSEEDMKRLMDDEKAHLLVTDPPYNVAYEGKTKDALTIKNDKMEGDNFYQFLYDFYKNAYDNLIDGAGTYIFHADTEGVNFRKAMVDAGFKLAECCVWVKNSLVLGRQDYHWRHEPCLYGWKPTGAHRWFSDRKQTTVWEFDRPTRNGEHPTMKPVPLIQYCIENSSQKNEIVLETFGGSGTTLIASDLCDRICYAMELDERYVDVIVRRYINHKQNEGQDVYLLRNGVEIPYSEIEKDFNKEN